MSTPASELIRVTVNHRRGRILEIGCSQFDCPYPGGTLSVRENGDVVYGHRERHDGNWHHQGKSLREMITILAVHDIRALRDLLGPELIETLAKL